MNTQRGQVAILVLVGVLFIFVMLLFFFLFTNEPIDTSHPSLSPRNSIDQCIIDSVNPSIQLVLDYGGLIGPRNYILNRDHEYNYLCFTDQYYEKCINNYPMLHKITQEQIRKNTFELVDECFNVLIEDYESRGYDVDHEALNYTVNIIPENVRLLMDKPLTATLDEDVTSFHHFEINIPSDLYDLIGITRQIVNQESQHCYFENNGFMILYPKYNLTRIDFYESKLYEVQNRQTEETFKFAIRSCPFAPGFVNAPV